MVNPPFSRLLGGKDSYKDIDIKLNQQAQSADFVAARHRSAIVILLVTEFEVIYER
jgi:hypothetical protein